MAAVKGRDTSPELALRRALHGRGLRFRVNPRDVVGKPDIVNRSRRIAIFVDGDFWHGNPSDSGPPGVRLDGVSISHGESRALGQEAPSEHRKGPRSDGAARSGRLDRRAVLGKRGQRRPGRGGRAAPRPLGLRESSFAAVPRRCWRMSRVHVLERGQRVELPIDQAFAFYGDAHNLERITPPWLGFEGDDAEADRDGRWDADRVPARNDTGCRRGGGRGSRPGEPPRRLVDAQVRGPYTLWGAHAHIRGGRAGGDDHPRPGAILDPVRAAGGAGRPLAEGGT